MVNKVHIFINFIFVTLLSYKKPVYKQPSTRMPKIYELLELQTKDYETFDKLDIY